MRDRLLAIIQSDTPDVAAVKAILAENSSEIIVSHGLIDEACDQYQIDMRNTARKDIIFLLLDDFKKREDPDYVRIAFSCYERFYQLFVHHSRIVVYKEAANLFKDRMYADRLSVSHLRKSVDGLRFVLGKYDKHWLIHEFYDRVVDKNQQAIDAFKIGEQGESSIIGFLTRHYYFIAKQRGELKKLFGHDVTTWSDFIGVLSMFGLDTRSEFVLYNQGEHPIGIARFLREKLNQPEVFLAVMQSPEANLILSQEDRQAGLGGVLNVDAFVKRTEKLLQASMWESASLIEVNIMKAELGKEKKLVQDCLESGVIAASQLTLPFLMAATRVMTASVVKSEVREERNGYDESFRPTKYPLIRDKYSLTFEDNKVFAEVGEGLLAKLSEDEKSWSVFPEDKSESSMLAFARYLTPEQAVRLVNEFASGQCESRLGYAMGKMHEAVNSEDWLSSFYKYRKHAYQFYVALLAKCGQIPSGFVERLPMAVKSQFSFDDYVALLAKAGITGLAVGDELRLVFPKGRRTLPEMKGYFNLLFSCQLSLADIVQSFETIIIHQDRHSFSNGYTNEKGIDGLIQMVAKHFELSVYDVCEKLTDDAKECMGVRVFLRVLIQSNAALPLSDIARLLTEKQRDKLKNMMIAGLREVGDIAAFIVDNGDFLGHVSSIIEEDKKREKSQWVLWPYSATSAEQQRSLNLLVLESMLTLLPNFRDWRALGVDLGWRNPQGETALDESVQRQSYQKFKFYFMNDSLQAHYRSFPLGFSAQWNILMTALTGISQHVFDTPGDAVLGLNSFEQSLIFWMTQKRRGDAVVDQLGWRQFNQDFPRNQVKSWKKMGCVYQEVKNVAKKSKIKDEGALNQEALQIYSFNRDGYDHIWDSSEVARLASFWMFETKAASKSSQGLMQPIQAACLVLLKQHASLRAALREPMVLGNDCLLLTVLQGNEEGNALSKETKAYVEARALLREMPLSDACVNELARRVDAKECTVRDVVLYLGLTPSLTDEQFSVIVNDFLNKSIDAKEGVEHAQIQDALLCLSEKEAEALKIRLSLSMVKSEDGRKNMKTLFAQPEAEANQHLIWHIIHAGRRTAMIKSTQNAKHVKKCLDHPEYSDYKIYGLFKLPPPASAVLDPARAQAGRNSAAGGVADRLIVNNARREHEEAAERNFPI